MNIFSVLHKIYSNSNLFVHTLLKMMKAARCNTQHCLTQHLLFSLIDDLNPVLTHSDYEICLAFYCVNISPEQIS